MKIGVAQIRPVKGDVHRNLVRHRTVIERAGSVGVDTLIFPELSLTGYEPALSEALATTPGDSRFDDLQTISDAKQIKVGAGMPIRSATGTLIGMLIFQPHQPRQVYAKQHLHSDEYPYFVKGQQPGYLALNEHKTALAICYELFVPDHAATAFQEGADLYIASVAKSGQGVAKAAGRLSEIARTYSMTVCMANCVGPCDNFVAGGQSAIWNNQGQLIGQLNDTDEGILLIDLNTQAVVTVTL